MRVRTNAVHNTLTPILVPASSACERLGHGDHAGFGRIVRPRPGLCKQASQGRAVHDVAAFAMRKRKSVV